MTTGMCICLTAPRTHSAFCSTVYLEPPMTERPAHFPALAVACPACGSAPGQLCTSHSGTRVRRNDVHQARTAAHRAQAAA